MGPLAERHTVQLAPCRDQGWRRGGVTVLEPGQDARNWPGPAFGDIQLVQLRGEPMEPALREPLQRRAAVCQHVPDRPAGADSRAVEGVGWGSAQDRQQRSSLG